MTKKKDGKPFGFDQEPSVAVQKDKFIVPDLAKLVRYKVEMSLTYALPNSEQIQLTATVSQLLNALPHGLWEGPRVEPEQVIKLIIENQLPPPPTASNTDHKGNDGNHAAEGGENAGKRKMDDTAEEGSNKPPASDIYRDRQAAKLSKMATGDKARKNR